jgi:hypothetical protein
VCVKTKTAGGFQWSAKPNGDIFLELEKQRDFRVLVDIPPGEENPTYYVVPTTVIDKWLTSSVSGSPRRARKASNTRKTISSAHIRR